ncbi:hypothetical protein [Hydrogenimonas urashimensis]|uniref:hypothetical protein n=1 Tax=Hydrogenimonas urashimensis TaxID=2740515 RepID=UPI00191669AE|nr:hypothetical protein [Hydrogenimonas urashimensis]
MPFSPAADFATMASTEPGRKKNEKQETIFPHGRAEVPPGIGAAGMMPFSKSPKQRIYPFDDDTEEEFSIGLKALYRQRHDLYRRLKEGSLSREGYLLSIAPLDSEIDRLELSLLSGCDVLKKVFGSSSRKRASRKDRCGRR